MLTAFLVFPSMNGSAQTRHLVKEASESKTGEKAIEELRRTGGYDLLKEAFRNASGQSLSDDYPTDNVIDTEQAQLTASDGAASDYFGYSVAVSGDTALIGSYLDDVGANGDQGSAYVFTRSGTTWTEQQKLTASDGALGDDFGYSVAVSGDTAVVTAVFHNAGGNSDQGSAYVFTRSGTTWTEQSKLTASDGAANDQFGRSVALSGDTAVVGAHADNVGANSDQGSAYVFTRSGTTWTEQAKLTASDGAASDYFGMSVALSGDTVVVGAWLDNVGANADQGSAYVFTRSGTTWTEQAKLTASDGAASDYFGVSVSVNLDTVAIGAPFDNVGANADQGSAYVFTRSGTTWTEQAKLTASDGGAGDSFGVSFSMSGNTAVVGAYSDNVGSNADQGSAYIFVSPGTTASGASLDGRVRTPSGAGLRNAIVSVTDQQGNVKSTRTGVFGGFHFEGLPVGEGYVVSVKSKNYTFAPRYVQLFDDLSGFEITPSTPKTPTSVPNAQKVRLR